jgi:hypothetical protein
MEVDDQAGESPEVLASEEARVCAGRRKRLEVCKNLASKFLPWEEEANGFCGALGA